MIRGQDETFTVARNVSTRYVAIAAEAAVGFLVLPFNIAHLGKAAYGLWMLTASVTTYFSVLDLGYGGALVKFVAQYRARRDPQALNEILSTTFVLFGAFGTLTYLVAIVLACYLDRLFHLDGGQASLGRIVLLIISLNVAVGTVFSVFGAVINGFQRYDLNNAVGTVSTIAAAAVNVAVLMLGGGLVALVAATTATRLLTLIVYRANAYRVFPELRIRLSLFSRARLREVTMFSVYMLIIDWANKMNYSVDAIVIGALLNTSAVAVWTVAQRLAEMTQRLTNQLNEVLFPTVVDNDSADRGLKLRAIFVQGTRLSLASVVPLGTGLMLMARPIVLAWVGPDFSGSAVILQLLAAVVMVRVGAATGGTLLKGSGRHRLLAFTNITAAVVNLGLSIGLAVPLGLAGVAVGTLVPVAAASIFVIFPAACRRVGLTLTEALVEAVWPAVWPAFIMAAALEITTPLAGTSFAAIAVQLIAAGALYAITFLAFGLSAKERHCYFSNAARWVAPRRVEPLSEGA